MEINYPSLNTLKISSEKPTLICDADEVIFDFMYEFELYLKTKNLSFNWKSYALQGNILRLDSTRLNGEEIKLLINSFFKSCTINMRLIKDVAKTLKKVSRFFNIIILSNIPFEYYNLRKKALQINNLNFPFFANIGQKGTASANICKMNNKQTWFIDDSPHQVLSVKKKEPKIKTILFIGNNKLANHVKNKRNCDFYSTNWINNEKILLKNLFKNDKYY